MSKNINTKSMFKTQKYTAVPLFFLIYINGLYLAIKYSEVQYFADDAHLVKLNSCINFIINR